MIARFGLIFAALCWAGNFAVGRVIAGDIAPVTLNTLRWSIAFCFLLPFAYRRLRVSLAQIRINIRWLLLMSCSGVVYHIFVYVALAYTTATNMALIISGTPAMTLILSWIIYRQRHSALRMAVVSLSFVGIAILVWGRLSVPNTGDMLGCVALVLWAYYNVSLRDCPLDIDGVVLTTVITLLGVIIMLPLLSIELLLGYTVQFTVPVIAAVLYVGLFASGIAFFLWNKASVEIGNVSAAQFMNLVPVFGVLIGTTILDEPFTLRHALATALVLISLIFSELLARSSSIARRQKMNEGGSSAR